MSDKVTANGAWERTAPGRSIRATRCLSLEFITRVALAWWSQPKLDKGRSRRMERDKETCGHHSASAERYGL